MRGITSKVLLLSSFLSLNYGADHVSSVSETAPGKFIWTINPPLLAEVIIDTTGVEFQDWNSTVLASGLKIPVLSKLVYTRGDPPRVQVTHSMEDAIKIDALFLPWIEQAKGLDLEISDIPKGASQSEIAVEKIGQEAGYSLWSVSVFGAQIQENLVYIPTGILELKISTDVTHDISEKNPEIYLNNISKSKHLGKNTRSGLALL